jgi:DNA (cytosine-5)-methyltransferase 1
MRVTKRPIAVDLFAGAGGMTLGFEQAGFDVLAAVEIDPIHVCTHEFNFPFWKVICASVVDITGSEIRQRSGIGDREIDVVCGGPPCQGFSLIGKRAINDPRNSLMFHFMRLVKELQPRYFVMENVKGLTIGNHQQFLDEVLEEFQRDGYEIRYPYHVLNACHYGVPQHRERLFIIGCRQGLTLPGYPPAITTPPKPTKPGSKQQIDLPDCPTVSDAILDLPEVENYPELLDRDWCKANYGKSSHYSAILRGLTSLKDDYSYLRQYDPSILTANARTRHTPESIGRFDATVPGKTEPISRFFKLAPDGICNTLRAGTPSNRGAFTSPRPIHPYTPRCITVREAARLHSYPDWFRFHVTKWHGFRQIGNSVPPLLAKAVAQEILACLRGRHQTKPSRMRELGQDSLLQLKMSAAAELHGVDRHVIAPRIRQALLIPTAIERSKDSGRKGDIN